MRAFILDAEGFTVFAMSANKHTTQESALAANARLVASAPSLLEALHHISLCSINSMSSREEMKRIAREAIQRATGGA